MKSPPKKWKWNSERVADLGWQVVGSVGPSATTPRANIFSLQKWILVTPHKNSDENGEVIGLF